MTTTRAVRFAHYGGVEQLELLEVDLPAPGEGEVLVEVRAAAINPGESAIREGWLDDQDPALLPSGQGSDLAGVVVARGAGVVWPAEGDEVLGWSWRRSSHAEHVVVPADQLVARPPELSWEIAGALYVVGATAWAAARAVGAGPGDTIAVSAAAGGVGTVLVQLLRERGARVLAIASPTHHDWLRERGAEPVSYGEGLLDRLRAAAPQGVDAFIDLYGPEYVRLAVELGVPVERIDTIISFAEAAAVGAKSEGSVAGTSTAVLTEIVELALDGRLEVPIAATYPLERVRDAVVELERGHTRGKVVLLPQVREPAASSEPSSEPSSGSHR